MRIRNIFEQGQLEAARREQDLLNCLEKLPGGKQKAKKTKQMISRLRNFIGNREYPEYLMLKRYWIIAKDSSLVCILSSLYK